MVVDAIDAKALKPRSLAEVKKSPAWPKWEYGIWEELKTLEEAGTWCLEVPPADALVVGLKWVFCAKKDVAGHVVLHKASCRSKVSITLTLMHPWPNWLLFGPFSPLPHI